VLTGKKPIEHEVSSGCMREDTVRVDSSLGRYVLSDFVLKTRNAAVIGPQRF
jgi:hypothetical protein